MAFDPDARLTEWRKSLLDTTKRNRLIKFVAGRVGGLYLLHPALPELWGKLVRDGTTLTFSWKRAILGLSPEMLDADALASDYDPGRGTISPDPAELDRALTEEALRSPHLDPKDLLTDFPDRLLAARLTRLYLTAKEAETEHGVTTLFAAFGFLRWYETPDSEEELLSPLLLVPVSLSRKTCESEFTLVAEDDDVLPNHCLSELLQMQFRIALPTATECPLDVENPECLSRYLAAVAEKVRHVPRWSVMESAALGVFNFQKLAMWEDLGRNAIRVKTHPLCRAIAGDSGVALAGPPDLPTAEQLDDVVPPDAAVHILDADSSQHEAIEAVRRGAHLVIDGPPGTGKSQTIANIIADALASGKRVLFVSEKTAALEVVKRRLDKCRLGDFCLALHSHKANKREIVSELGQCLGLTSQGVPDTAARLQELGATRHRVNEFVAELHAVREPLGLSAYQVHGELARLDRTPGRSRLPIPDVFSKTPDYVRDCCAILAKLSDCHTVLEEPGGHPWRGCKVTAFTNVVREDAEYLLGRLSDVTTPAARAADALVGVGFATEPVTAPAWRAAETDARCILSAPPFPAEWFQGDPRGVAESLIELDSAAGECHEIVDRLRQFDPAAVQAITDPKSIAELTAGRQRLHDTELSARDRLETLLRIEEKLRELAGVAAELDPTARTVAGLLQMSGTPGADQMDDLASVATEIADGPAIPPTWWESAHRTELLALLARGAEEQRLAREQARGPLSRFLPEALAPESLAVVMEAEVQGRSFWTRLLPQWWKLKKKIAAWYTMPNASSAMIRADLVELASYHRRLVAVRQIMAHHAADLSTITKGEPDWERTAARLRAVEWLDRAGVQHTFKTPIARHRTFDHPALTHIAARLSRLATALRDGWEGLLTDFVVPDPAARLARPLAELATWLRLESDGCQREAKALAVLLGAVLPDHDLTAADFVARAADLQKLVAARMRILAAARVLNDKRSITELETADHKDAASRARALLDVLQHLGCSLTPPVVAAFTDPAVREKLAAVVKQSDTARRPFDKAWDKVVSDLFDPTATVSTNVVMNEMPLAKLGKWASERTSDGARLAEWATFVKLEKDVAACGLGQVLDEVRAGEFPAAAAAEAFRGRFYRLWLDSLQNRVPVLASFVAETHDRLVARFAELDRLIIRSTPDRVRGQLLENPSRPRNRDNPPDTSELGILLREVNKKRRHLPLRHLFRQIPSILKRLKPCMMMSPLAVSTYLDTPELTFDLVIFDEASQVRPHDAISAIYRSSQLVVGGDPKQLPPTDFFTRAGEDAPDEDKSGTGGFESLLDVCLSLGVTRKRLRWHYRSRREGLIAFSNHNFYDGRLITFPSPDEATGSAVRLERVADGVFADGVNVVEAQRVAAMVMDYARTTPDRSLGVIAFSLRQQDRILAEIEVLRRKNTYAEPFFAEDRDDLFFVKNLENVQGDERDSIILSVGYGPDVTGKVPMRFGPLNREGGERRLNVAITRARHAMTVVASMTAADIDLTRTGAVGARLLKDFLDYAENGPATLTDTASDGDARASASLFERAVGDELEQRGLTIHRRVGCGGYHIDIAIADPTRDGKYILGIECDGPIYHSAATARDRDRLRKVVLEGLGWRLIRVWSGEWIRDREKQVRRLLAAVEAARASKPVHEAEPEKPNLIRTRAPRPKSQSFESIEFVPPQLLLSSIAAALTDYGSMHADDLVTTVTKRLGFKRTGPKIRERVTETINAQISAGAMIMDDDARVRLVAT